MRRRLWFALGILVFAAVTAQADESAWKAVWQSEDALDRLSLSGRVNTQVTLTGKLQQATATVRAARGKLRLDYETGTRRWTLIDNGSNLIQLRPTTRRAIVMPRPKLAFDRALAERNYVARRSGSDTVAERPVQVIEITPRARGKAVWRLWLDQQTFYVLKRERYNVDGVLTTSTEYTSIDFSAKNDPSLFTIPAGYTQMGGDGSDVKMSFEALQQKVDFMLVKPRYIPAGYVLLGGYLREHGERRKSRERDTEEGGPSAELRYTDGVRLLSIVQRAVRTEPKRRTRGDVSEIVNRGSEKVLREIANDRVIVVVGDLPKSELTRVAQGVE